MLRKESIGGVKLLKRRIQSTQRRDMTTVGSTTDQSSLFNQVQKYSVRTFQRRSEDAAKTRKYRETCASLSERCVDVVVKNFDRYPVHENIPARCMREITSRLPSHLDVGVAAEFIFDEGYWKKRCHEQLLERDRQINEHGLTWKQLFFEKHLQQVCTLSRSPHLHLRNVVLGGNRGQV